MLVLPFLYCSHHEHSCSSNEAHFSQTAVRRCTTHVVSLWFLLELHEREREAVLSVWLMPIRKRRTDATRELLDLPLDEYKQAVSATVHPISTSHSSSTSTVFLPPLLLGLLVVYLCATLLPAPLINQTFMAESIDKSKFEKMSAFVLGYTGEVGKLLAKRLLEDKLFAKVVLIGRRQVEYGEDGLYKDVEQRVVDFDKIDDYKDTFAGFDVGFCALGSTASKHGKEMFYKVDHDYIVNTARVASQAGCKHFSIVSSSGADASSFFYYMKTKGQVENEVADMGFDRVSIYRPAMLLCDREEQRLGEKVGTVALKPINWLLPTAFSVPTDAVAKAMIFNLFLENKEKKEIIENRPIHELGKRYDANK